MNGQEIPAAEAPCRSSRRLIVSYGSTDKAGAHVPYMRLRGLQDAGFVIGRYVRIEVGEGGRLMIEQID
jgi:hypothetical protein